jgi:uncharacterized protein YhdP
VTTFALAACFVVAAVAWLVWQLQRWPQVAEYQQQIHHQQQVLLRLKPWCFLMTELH